MPTMEDIITSLNQAQEDTRKANESRYTELLDLLKSRTTGAASLLDSSGSTAERQARQRYDEENAQSQQSLIDRGLYGSSVLEATRGANLSRLGDELGGIREQTDRAKVGAYLSTTGDTAGAMERRTDAYPDMGPYIDLIRQQSQAQAGAPGRTNNFVGATPGGSGGGGGVRGGGSSRSSGSSGGGFSGGGGGGGYDGGGGGGGGAQGGVQSFTSGGSGAMRGFGDALNPLGGGAYSSGPSMILPGSSIYLGGRALTSGGGTQGVGGSGMAPGLQNPGFLNVTDMGSGQSGGYYNGMLPPGWDNVALSGAEQSNAAGATPAAPGAADEMVRAFTGYNRGEKSFAQIPKSDAEWSGNLQQWYKRGVA